MQNYLDGRSVLKMENSAVTPPNAASDFQPLLMGAFKNKSGDANGDPGAMPTEDHLETPKIELVTQDGKIQRIIITCTCCKRIELDCEY